MFLKEPDGSRNPFDYANRHSSDALDRGTRVLEVAPYYSGGSMEMMQFERNRSQQMRLLQRTASSDVASDDQYKSLDRFGSIDSEDTFLSCNTHPFPSQGSLAGLEELAALGSMAPNGSMPAVNIPSFNNNASGYANPFDPSGAVSRGQHRRRGGKQVCVILQTHFD